MGGLNCSDQLQRVGEDIYPYMLVNIGSGVSFIKVWHPIGAGQYYTTVHFGYTPDW